MNTVQPPPANAWRLFTVCRDRDGEAWDFFDEASAVGDNNRPRAMTATPIQDAIANLAV